MKDKKNVVAYEKELVPKEKRGKFYKKQQVIRIYVQKKHPIEALDAKDIVPSEFEDIPIDIVEIGEIKPLGAKDRMRPLVAGVSAMNYKGSACTLGWFAVDERDGKLVIIANNHCVARENKAKIGEAYMQPSPHDGGKYPRDIVGTLKRFVPLDHAEYNCQFRSLGGLRNWWRKRSLYENKVDLGIVEITEGVDVTKEIYEIGRIYGKRNPVIDDTVQKCGRTTGHTKGGRVIGTSWAGQIQYSRGSLQFVDCVVVRRNYFSAGGDSSSAIPTQKSKPEFLGLLFAGSNTHTVFCKLSNIEAFGEVSVWHEGM